MEKLKKFFRSGAGEFLGAAIVLPFIMAIIMFIVNIFQIAMCEQELIYAAYSCGREAVISYDYESAEANAQAWRDAHFAGDGIDVSIDPKEIAWIKGNVLMVTAEKDLKPVLGIQSGVHARKVAMMIEHSKWTDEVH